MLFLVFKVQNDILTDLEGPLDEVELFALSNFAPEKSVSAFFEALNRNQFKPDYQHFSNLYLICLGTEIVFRDKCSVDDWLCRRESGRGFAVHLI